jgi:hypothetical protein
MRDGSLKTVGRESTAVGDAHRTVEIEIGAVAEGRAPAKANGSESTRIGHVRAAIEPLQIRAPDAERAEYNRDAGSAKSRLDQGAAVALLESYLRRIAGR